MRSCQAGDSLIWSHQLEASVRAYATTAGGPTTVRAIAGARFPTRRESPGKVYPFGQSNRNLLSASIIFFWLLFIEFFIKNLEVFFFRGEIGFSGKTAGWREERGIIRWWWEGGEGIERGVQAVWMDVHAAFWLGWGLRAVEQFHVVCAVDDISFRRRPKNAG